ncbi:MAG: glycosyltransferase family 9 protein [Candidatus Latescibacteria bacterium]|nr:glycosyltransferase family 9 protein [Candidatus Latescibacterota bacterium]
MNDILFIRFSSLGDIVLTSAVIEAFRKKYHDARIYYMTRNEYSGLFYKDNRIDELITVHSGESPVQIIKRSGKETYDAVIDLHGTLRSRMITALLKSPRKIRLNKHAIARRFMVWSHNRYRRQFDVLESYLDTLRPFGIRGKLLPCLKPSDECLRTARVILGLHCKDKPFKCIGIAPGAKHSEKRWNEKSYANLADEMVKAGHTPIFIGDMGDKDIIERIRSIMTAESLSLAGQIDLSVTVGVISLLKVLITNDSGPMHIAGAAGTPFVAVFGPTHPDLGFVPGYPSGAVLHSGISCSPCSIHGEKPCRMKRRFCMDEITVEMVLEEVKKVT